MKACGLFIEAGALYGRCGLQRAADSWGRSARQWQRFVAGRVHGSSLCSGGVESCIPHIGRRYIGGVGCFYLVSIGPTTPSSSHIPVIAALETRRPGRERFPARPHWLIPSHALPPSIIAMALRELPLRAASGLCGTLRPAVHAARPSLCRNASVPAVHNIKDSSTFAAPPLSKAVVEGFDPIARSRQHRQGKKHLPASR